MARVDRGLATANSGGGIPTLSSPRRDSVAGFRLRRCGI